MDRLDLYRIFARVIETRSFTRAADGLQMPRSTVSTAVAELEARLGARLLQRTTRSVSPTPEGEALHRRCLPLLSEAEDVESMFRAATRQIQGRVRVDVPGRIGRLILIPALPLFLADWPGILVDVGVSDRPVDLVGEQIDLALRVGALPDSSLRARRISEIAQINVASPAYLARHGTPRSPADLDRHLQVAYASPSNGRVFDWEWKEDGRTRERPVPWQVSANCAEGYIACALAGMGLIQIPAYDVAQHLAKGELVEVMPDHRPAPMPMHLLFPHPRPSRRVQLFADWLEALLRQSVSLAG